MKEIHDEFNDLQIRIEDIKMRVQTYTDEIRTERISNGDIASTEMDPSIGSKPIEEDVKNFIDRLTQRLPFIARQIELPHIDTYFVYKRFSSVDLKMGASPRQMPFDCLSICHLLTTRFALIPTHGR